MNYLFTQVKYLAISMVALTMLTFPAVSIAQTCSSYTEQNDGNLIGNIIVTNLPEGSNVIYTSSATDPWSGGPSYGIVYDRELQIFSGRGWLEGINVWIDFDYGTSDQAQILDAGGDPIGGFYWGYWDSVIEGLDDVYYSVQEGEFVTPPYPKNSEYVSGTSSGDVPIGLGNLDFSNLSFDVSETTIPVECQEYIDVLADGATQVHLPSCDDTVGLVWNSSNVETNSCETVANGAPWLYPGPREEENFTPEPSGPITEANTPAFFSIKCVGEISGNPVIGTAKVTCGDTPDEPSPGEPGSETPFEFIES